MTKILMTEDVKQEILKDIKKTDTTDISDEELLSEAKKDKKKYLVCTKNNEVTIKRLLLG